MILQALNAYYERLAGEDEGDIPLRGFSRQPVPFALEIDAAGALQQVLDLRDHAQKKKPRQLVLPEPLKTSGSGFSANFAWDNTGYVLGADEKDKPQRALQAFECFKQRLHEVAGHIEDEGLAAVRAFLEAWSPEMASELADWKDMAGRNLIFRMAGDRCFVHERPAVRAAWRAFYETTASEHVGQCLVIGKTGPIAATHPKIKGVMAAQSSGATLISCNLDAFTSYGKKQNHNSPISEEASFNYTTALNDLLKSGSRQRIQFGDATTVFWTERATTSELLFGEALSPNETKGDLVALRQFLEAARDGKMPDKLEAEKDVRFYVLGLAPNAARLSVRFWHVDTVEGIWRKIGQHFSDLRIVKAYDKEPDFPPMWQLLRATAKREELDNLSPLLAGAFMRAIFEGAAYPRGLFAAVIGRIRAEQKIGTFRAALIKACLVRNARMNGQTPEVSVSLDETSTNTAYRLGRLFAVLEKLQQEAIPGANSTIKDRYYGSASATPRSVFPLLLRLAQHHCAKAEYGHVSDRRIAEIVDSVSDFPAHLNLEEQGRFALGYYQQRTSLWTKKAAATENTTPSTEQ